MNYTDLAKKITEEMLEYRVTTESLNEIYDILYTKLNKNNDINKGKILALVTHYITIKGYDIECIKPLKFKRYKD